MARQVQDTSTPDSSIDFMGRYFKKNQFNGEIVISATFGMKEVEGKARTYRR